MMETMVQLQDVCKEFRRGATAVKAVGGVSLTVEKGEFISLMGKSGSGKSTVLHLMCGLLAPSSGKVRLLGQAMESLTDDQLTLLRRQRIGFIFQSFNLLPSLTAAENVALPLLLDRVAPAEAMKRAAAMLELVGMGHRAQHKPDEMSGGQMQRVAIARALVNAPPLIFADEPTGNLDTASSAEIMLLLREMQEQRGHTIVMVTHDPKAAAYGNRLITLRDGRVVEDLKTGGVAV